MNEKIHAPKSNLTCPVAAIYLHGGRPVVGAPGGAGCPATGFPRLNTNNCNKGKNDGSEKLSSAHRKTAYALTCNVLLLIARFDLERIGFLTLTFGRHVVDYKTAQKALHNLMTGVLKHRYQDYIIVMERMDSKRIHYHLLITCPVHQR